MEKKRVWLIQIPLILLWTLCFLVAERGDDGLLTSRVLRTAIYPTLRRLEGFYTDQKFRLRGPRPTRQKIVIVEVDDRAIEQLGRWPWHRDALALLIQQAMDAGAKAVGLDVVFPEPDIRVPDGVAELLGAHQLGGEIPKFETDLMLQRIIALNRDRLVLGWMSDGSCRPAYPDDRPCNPMDPEALAKLPKGFGKFGYQIFTAPVPLDAAHTPIATAPDLIGNLPSYDEAAAHAGYLVNAAEDPDDVVRRAQVMLMVNGQPHPSMPLEMARLGLKDELRLVLDARGLVEDVRFVREGLRIPVSPVGTLSINFRGPGYHFPYVGALDLMGDEVTIPIQHDGKIENVARAEIFKDAYVMIGVTAIGARDLRHFPFGSNTPGTEGLATILDNVLSGDPLLRHEGVFGRTALLLLMTLGAFLFGLAMLKLEALPAMAVSLLVMGVVGLIDVGYVFSRRNIDLNAIFLACELATIFVATVAVKYVLEERGKKLIRGTFSKYLAPAVVDQMLKDPENLQLGGESRKLTIMMSDLRGFTATAERLKPQEVLGMLNNYLGTMADIIVDYEGTIDEFIGDAILVIFGAPIEKKDDARRAVACSIAMQRAVKGINERNAAAGLPPIDMGLALNTGEVIVGNIGSQKHIKYGVVGSHVNLTARIESNTVGGQILISESTLELAGADIKVGEKQMIVAKGFPLPIAAYEILGIGGEYNLFLEELDLQLVAMEPPLEVRYRIMKSKNEEGEEEAGRFTSLSKLGAVMEGGALEKLKNLKIRVFSAAGEPVGGDLYVKVLDTGTPCRLRFTAVTPELEAFIKARLATVTSATTATAAPTSGDGPSSGDFVSRD